MNKKVYEVIADYLRLLWEYTIEDIRKFHLDYIAIFAIRVVLIVPAIWKLVAKDKTLQAARLASILDGIKLVTEPKAAALATLKDKAEENNLKV